MEVFKTTSKFPFMKYRWVAILFSLSLIVTSVCIWSSMGNEKFGVDFLGGVEAVIEFPNPIDVGQVRGALEKAGINDSIIQNFTGSGNKFSVRFRPAEHNEQIGQFLETTFQAIPNNAVKIIKLDNVGPVIGEQIRKDAVWAVIWALVGIMVYLAVRFEMRFAVGAVIALLHDVIITVGFCLYTGREINAGVLAALLTIVGYSVNDTIIVFDRIREELLKAIKKSSKEPASLSSVIDLSINETLSRTIITSMTVIFVCLALYIFGGGAVESLAFTLFVGVTFGTYSSVYVASVLVLELGRFGSGKLALRKS